MLLRRIDILDFKNIPEAALEFSPGVNCLLGMNGMGKSNLLEAIHFLCLARGMSSMPESALIRHGRDMLMVKGSFETDGGAAEEVSVGIVRGKGKTLKRNGKTYDRISSHIGQFPVVCVTPEDSMLVTGGGEERRRLMDIVLSQSHPSYLSALIRYNRALESRNRMLRAGVRDALLYESVEDSMEGAANAIHAARREWTETLSPVFAQYYAKVSGGAETASIRYRSALNDTTFRDLLNERRAKDTVLGYTSAGVHRDDILTGLGDYSMKRLGSQGQVKTYTIAMRLAIFDYLKREGGVTPILLLDDIFDKLDASRVGRIMDLVSTESGFSQIFITDTNREHIDEILASISGARTLLEVKEGTFTPIRAL
ncbi:MAG: DNA replication and repair protein RecF [Muribaculaceae bacterium]|nr:DNA replication and repair protein RecF [Muribaculaceae bacterium]